ncbi:helix-turn-helix domain-containing protein [Actinomadura rudentiformis]|uniref:Helix-turn-helix domain-containing protein n=1 Tax=Actinomadura rudentiformis TaxID=359158 RepID=A0A6H9Z9A9_9ACTN|nr:helix-turn-helix transcriptional regulator [Actinomadura rudentiformis]KAB2351786.1 helix-turn-helix domain-containing protein [Actinomadura rudentiformis]
MSASPRPSVRQRRLAAELRRLREERRLTGDDVAAELSWSTAKVSRIENARTGARISDVRRLLRLYQVNGQHHDELIALAEDAAEKGWWEEYRDLIGGYPDFIAMEAEANSIKQWETHTMPGLLQTEEYAREVISGWNAIATIPPREIDRRIEVRMRRQEILRQSPRPAELSVVIDESVLRRRVGGTSVMRGQIEHLLAITELNNVRLRVLPLEGAHPVMEGSFILLEFAPVHDVIFPDVVHTESLAVSHFEDEMTTHMYRLAYQALCDSALDYADSKRFIAASLGLWR